MKKLKKKIAIFIAGILVVVSLSGCGALSIGAIAALDMINNGDINSILDQIETTSPAFENEPSTTVETTTAEETTEVQTVSSEKSGLLPEYEHYDSSDFIAKCDELKKLSEEGKSDEVNALYDELYKEAIYIQNLFNVSELLSYENTSDKSKKEENEYMHDVTTDTTDKFAAACRYITESKCAGDFKKHLNDDYLTDYYETYEEDSERLKELSSEETKLQNEYNTLMDNMNDITTEINGQTYRFGDLLEYEDNSLFTNDYTLFMKAFNACYKELNERAGEIFLQLVKIRDEIAKENGYDNYNDYADENVYGRDYSESDLEKMKAAVREFGTEYQEYYYMLYNYLPGIDTSADNLIDMGKECISGISPLSDKAMQYFESNQLYSIGNEKGRVDAGFTTTFSKEDGNEIPYIYIKTSDSAYDLITFTHEFGHFTNSYWNPNPYPLFMTGSYDLFEIHSTGLQLLVMGNYSKAFGNDADSAYLFNVLNLIGYIVDGCMYDEWQREIYKNPDMTLDEINNLFKEISEDYGNSYYDGQEYSWVEVNHNFTSPLYYISYATSAFASLQIWLQSNNDFSTGVSTWENVMGAGAYDDGYMTVIKNAGLMAFNNKDNVLKVLNDSYAFVKKNLPSAY